MRLRCNFYDLRCPLLTVVREDAKGSFHVKTANGSHSTLSDFAETSSKWVFWWIMKICKVLASGHFLFKKYAPPNFAPPSCKKFFAFLPNFESSYLWIEVTQIAQNWNFYRQFPTNLRYFPTKFDLLQLLVSLFSLLDDFPWLVTKNATQHQGLDLFYGGTNLPISWSYCIGLQRHYSNILMYFGNCWKLFSYIDEHTMDKCMNCYASCYQIWCRYLNTWLHQHHSGSK